MIDNERIRKVLELEQARGYSDRAVIGGLDRYLARLLEQGPDDGPPSASGRLGLTPGFSYAGMDVEQRRRWVAAALANLTAGGPAPPAAQPNPPPEAPPSAGPRELEAPVTALKGISTVTAARLARLGVQTVRDMLYFFPRRYLDYSQSVPVAELRPGREQTVVAVVWESSEVRLGNRKGTEAIVGDETGNVRAVWFNQPYLAGRLKAGARIVLSGKVSAFRGMPQLESPEWEPLEATPAGKGGGLVHTGRMVPLYPLTHGLSPRPLRKLVKQAVDAWADRLPDFLPTQLKRRLDLLDLPEAVQQAHYPKSQSWQDRARRRLAFDELLLLQLGVLARKRDWQQGQQSHPLPAGSGLVSDFVASLPFPLTGAQQKVLGEILADVRKPVPMCRLLQGEVGSGKTVVATAAMLAAVAGGFQAALMAPTEVLAEQHFHSVTALLSPGCTPQGAGLIEGRVCTCPGPGGREVRVALLTGSLTQKERRLCQKLLSEGGVDLAIGTHALIQKGVGFERLALAVVDEQHRFGVEQRSALRQKGFNPHLLVMTATPIPRTLALSIYGDLDLSVIDQLPPGRKKIETKWLSASGGREQAYRFIKRKVGEGRQAFVICPLIEEAEGVAARAATAEYQRLSQEVFPQLRLGLLHGRMRASEKEQAMALFKARELDILVSTSVIEVGIDVPNATVMLIEGADRFGLSQLHQFRGRVGRGEHQSYCMLLADSPATGEAEERLKIIETTQDGFVLAEEDMKLRGPGEFFGTRQSGIPDLQMARLSDVALLETARREATSIFQVDANLQRPEHRLLAAEMLRRWGREGERS